MIILSKEAGKYSAKKKLEICGKYSEQFAEWCSLVFLAGKLIFLNIFLFPARGGP
jgi:hypothetical protein